MTDMMSCLVLLARYTVGVLFVCGFLSGATYAMLLRYPRSNGCALVTVA